MQFKRVALTSHLFIPESELTEVQAQHLKQQCSVRSNFSNDMEHLTLFQQKKGWLGVPLYHFHLPPGKCGKRVDDLRVTGTPLIFKFRATLRPGQEPVIDSFCKHLQKGVTGFGLEADPGFGKTVAVIKMMQLIALSTLVVVPRSNLVEQWISRIVEHTNLKRKDIGYVNGNSVSWHGKKVVIGLVHSLALDRLGKDFRTSFGCVVFDEVDRSVPPATFAPAVGLFPSKYRIGCSATIKRQDGLDVVFRKHIFQVIIHGVAGAEEVMKPSAIMVDFNPSSGSVPVHLGKMQRRGMLLSRLAKNPARNAVLAYYINLIYKSGRQTVVLSDRIEHLVTLRSLVCSKYNIPLQETGFYVRSLPNKFLRLAPRKRMSASEHRRVASDCRLIFATYQMFAIGTDIPILAGLVYATPQSEVIQSKGRIERVKKGKKQPVLVDIYDSAYEETRRWAAKRMNYYREAGMSIKRLR